MDNAPAGHRRLLHRHRGSESPAMIPMNEESSKRVEKVALALERERDDCSDEWKRAENMKETSEIIERKDWSACVALRRCHSSWPSLPAWFCRRAQRQRSRRQGTSKPAAPAS